MSSPDGSSPPTQPAKHGCLAVALIIVGGLITMVSGLCVGGGLVGTVLDLKEGAAPIENTLGVTFMYLLVSGPFLAGGIALIVWGVRIQRRQ